MQTLIHSWVTLSVTLSVLVTLSVTLSVLVTLSVTLP